jgi:hypothetical protein
MAKTARARAVAPARRIALPPNERIFIPLPQTKEVVETDVVTGCCAHPHRSQTTRQTFYDARGADGASVPSKSFFGVKNTNANFNKHPSMQETVLPGRGRGLILDNVLKTISNQ